MGWKYEPRGLTAAQLNLPFSVATYLMEGAASSISSTRLPCTTRPHRAVRARGGTRRSGHHGTRREVPPFRTRAGARSADTPRGGDANFAPAADIVDKFEKLAVHALPKARVAELRDAVLKLGQLADAAELAALMAT